MGACVSALVTNKETVAQTVHVRAGTPDTLRPKRTARINHRPEVVTFSKSNILVLGNIPDMDDPELGSSAASKGHSDIVKFLISCKGVDLNVRGDWGTPLKEAIDDKRVECAELLRKAGAIEN